MTFLLGNEMALIICNDCKRRFSSDAKKCIHCGAGKPLSNLKLVIYALLTVVIIYNLAQPPSPLPITTPEDQKKSVMLATCGVAEETVRRGLLSPSTASFPGCIEYNFALNEKQTTMIVTGYVDAENAFGASLRQNWMVTLSRGPGEDAARASSWSIRSVYPSP